MPLESLDAPRRDATVMLIYGAHLLRNGTGAHTSRTNDGPGLGLTHLATNGAGTIHDWEICPLVRFDGKRRDGAGRGKFGTWNETATNIHFALMAGRAR